MPEPSIVKITITEGPGGKAVFPNTSIQNLDSVFWLNQTGQNHQPAYDSPNGQILWGPPPNPLPPGQTSSQIQFSTPGAYTYYCTLHAGETGKITVT